MKVLHIFIPWKMVYVYYVELKSFEITNQIKTKKVYFKVFSNQILYCNKMQPKCFFVMQLLLYVVIFIYRIHTF